MSEISQRMLEAAAAHRESMREAREGFYRAPTRNDCAAGRKGDTAHGPVVSVSIDDYLAELAAK